MVLQNGLPVTLSELDAASAATRAALAEPVAQAAGTTFIWALALTAVTLLPALLLPSSVRRPEVPTRPFGEPERRRIRA